MITKYRKYRAKPEKTIERLDFFTDTPSLI